MRHQLYVDGRALSEFGVYISGEGTYNAPARSVTEEVVPGRDGTLIIDNGRFENIIVTYPAFILQDFASNIEALRNWLGSRRGYVRINDTYHSDEYRMGVYSSGLEAETSGHWNRYGQFNLAFNCKPQRFLTSGETAVTFSESGTILNPTQFDARPIIRIYGEGTVGIGQYSITFDGSTEYVDVDCGIHDAYSGSSNRNSAITLSPNDFPVLRAGDNGVVLGSGITSVRITPNWWRV